MIPQKMQRKQFFKRNIKVKSKAVKNGQLYPGPQENVEQGKQTGPNNHKILMYVVIYSKQ